MIQLFLMLTNTKSYSTGNLDWKLENPWLNGNTLTKCSKWNKPENLAYSSRTWGKTV